MAHRFFMLRFFITIFFDQHFSFYCMFLQSSQIFLLAVFTFFVLTAIAIFLPEVFVVCVCHSVFSRRVTPVY